MFGGELEKIRIQKLLFLYTQKKKNPEYEFIPYKYGCYSYSANADLITMVKKGNLLENENNYLTNSQDDYLKNLKIEDALLLKEVVKLYGSMSNNSLIKHTYLNFPYYAINSTIAENLLTKIQLEKVKLEKVKTEDIILFTIGYEGVSLENYLNKLIKNDVRLLVDVRKNPLSMKFGFSKTLLKRYCESLGIAYLHFPEVGIHSDQRQELNSQADYDALFEIYKTTTLVDSKIKQKEILDLLLQYNRIALTCFEENICQCHRKPLAESIKNFPTFEYVIKHI